MKKIDIQPTATASWHRLIRQAQAQRHITLGEALESYLVFLLMRFTDQSDFANSIIAIDFLESFRACRPDDHFQEVGDKCLLLSGLFPERAKKLNVNIDYFNRIGQSAYANLIEDFCFVQDDLYRELTQEFITLRDTLETMRNVDTIH